MFRLRFDKSVLKYRYFKRAVMCECLYLFVMAELSASTRSKVIAESGSLLHIFPSFLAISREFLLLLFKRDSHYIFYMIFPEGFSMHFILRSNGKSRTESRELPFIFVGKRSKCFAVTDRQLQARRLHASSRSRQIVRYYGRGQRNFEH